MNFQYLKPVERSNSYLDAAFNKAREKSNKKLAGEWLSKIKKKELIKLDSVKSHLTGILTKIIEDFPNLEGVPPFYRELIRLTIDYPSFKKSLGAVDWAVKKIKFFHKNYTGKISRTHEAPGIKRLRREFYGRISSVMKQIDKNLIFLEESRKVLKNYPDVKDLPTGVIFGFPNVGKTTLLNKLTGSTAKVAGYSFTTLGVNSGFLSVEGKKIQILDVPGTLARMDKMNDVEKIAYLTVKELADFIIYVFDLSETSSSLKNQEKLFRNLKNGWGKGKKIFIYLSKQDLVSKKEVEEFGKKHKFLDLAGLKENIPKLV